MPNPCTALASADGKACSLSLRRSRPSSATDHAGWRWHLRTGPRCEGQSAISRPHPRNRQSHGSNGDLPRVFTADTLIARQSLPSQDVRVSPLASIPAITGVIRPEEAGCSRGPADRISGAQAPGGAERPSKDGMRSETILPFLILCPDPGLKAALPLLALPRRE